MPCEKERFAYLKLGRSQDDSAAQCKKSGEYKEVQCYGHSGECWCVDKDGREVRGTRRRGDKPLCLPPGQFFFNLNIF